MNTTFRFSSSFVPSKFLERNNRRLAPEFVGLLMEVKAGDKAPDFTLPSQMGDAVKLSEFLGRKNIVLYFYPKDESIGCTKEACAFRDSYEVFTTLGAQVLGVSSQSVESHKSFASHYGLPFILLSDEGGKVRQLYGVPSTFGIIPGRVTYIIDKQGIVRHVFNSQSHPELHIEEAIKVLKEIEEEQSRKESSLEKQK